MILEYTPEGFNHILKNQKTPTDSKKSMVVPIIKSKGDIPECNNYGIIRVLRNAVGVSDFTGKKRYGCVRVNVISVTSGWVGVQCPGK